MCELRWPHAAAVLLAIALGAQGAPGWAQGLNAEQQLARDIYQELLEINTVTALGDTLKAAQAMAARLRAGGFAEADVKVLSPGPRKGNLVARLRGSGVRRPMMLLAHIDVVSASAEDWGVEPFKLLEKDGYFYGRGVADNKYMASAFVANLIRYKKEGLRPERDLILVLETDEEILDEDAMGIQWLLKHHRELIDAEFALNEGAGVVLSQGKPLSNGLQTSEKVSVPWNVCRPSSGGRAGDPDDVFRRYRRQLLAQCRHTHVWPFRPCFGARQRSPWPQRAGGGEVLF